MAKAAAKEKKRTARTVKVRTPVKRTVPKRVLAPKKKNPQKGKAAPADIRYRCRLCGYIYSPIRGEPHNGISPGTAFEDLPDTYVCPVCGFQGKGKIGKWGFDEWRPTLYICSVCGYVYDEARGEPHRGIKPGTRFDDLPDTYVCPVCALDVKLTKSYGKVSKQGFGPLNF